MLIMMGESFAILTEETAELREISFIGIQNIT